MINLVIASSQQDANKCVMGDTEADHMYSICKALYDLVSPDKRLNVYLVPRLKGTDTEDLRESTRLSNEFIKANGPGYHLELHSDAGAYAKGASGLYVSENGRKFVTPIMEELMKLTPWPDVGIRKRTDLYALNQTTAVAGLIEVSFHDNPEEAKWIHENTKQIALAIMTGMYKFFGFEAPTDGIDWKAKYADLRKSIQEIIERG
jgi:N-acetylmuramoyl-L-alanine amidase